MSGTVASIARIIPNSCRTTHCNKDKCRVDLAGAPQVRVIVDMDCDALSIPNNWKRCDYLFVGEESNETWVAPIELKSGRFSVSAVLEQLAGGTRMANMWLPQGVALQFAPVLAHGKTIHRNALKTLRAKKLQLRGQRKGIAVIKCGDQLTKALGA